MVFESSGVGEAVVDVLLEVSESYGDAAEAGVGSDSTGGRSERREGYPQPLLRPANKQLAEEPINNLQKSH